VDRDLAGLTVSLQPGYEIPGYVQVEDSSQADLGALGVTASAAAPYTIMIAGRAPVTFGTRVEGKVAADGKFVLSGVFADATRLTVSGLPDGFYVKSIQMGDQEVLESGLDLANGPGGAIRITLSGKAATVSGSISDADEKPVGGATVVLIPKPEKRRSSSQFLKTARADQQGRFTIKGVDPGDYKAYAWEDVENMAWLDPEFLKPVESKGVALTVDPSGQHQLQLKAIAAGQ
jgi:hypothetical protein